ncbi:MAG: NADPH-dependent glutamate synthase [Thermodesulfobacteriota bacterium]
MDMPVQDPAERVKNFREVALGYSLEQAMTEASRCLQCKKPACRPGCPVEIDIKGFIAPLAKGDVAGAYAVLREYNSLPAVCGRVCPQESQCEGSCILGKTGEPVAIGRLERFVADNFHALSACEVLTGGNACRLPREDLRVACIGAGPSSLTVAGYLAARGARVEVYEALHELGGVLVYGIPEFRLPKQVVKREIDALRTLGVEFHTNWVGGKTFTIRELFVWGYKAVFIGVGAGLPRFLGVPGEGLVGVFSANEYLTRANLGRAYAFPTYSTPIYPARDAVVVGGGNVAMDAARTAKRLGAERVTVVYRRTRDEMPARREEIEHAEEEGVHFELLANPVELKGDEAARLTHVRLQRQALGEPDASGRRKPVPTDEYFEIPAQMVIVAVGTRSNPVLIEATPDLALSKRGYVEVDEATGETSIPNVFAGGDIVTGAATVISAMGAGRRAAKEIARRLGIPNGV